MTCVVREVGVLFPRRERYGQLLRGNEQDARQCGCIAPKGWWDDLQIRPASAPARQLGFPNQAAVVEEVKRLAGYCNDGFRKSDVQDTKLQDQIDELEKQQNIKFVGALRMAKVEVKTAEQRLEVAGQQQFRQTGERIRVERNRITLAHQHFGKLFACTS